MYGTLLMELCSMLCATLDGSGFWGEWAHVYVVLSPFAVLYCSIVNWLYPNTKEKIES